MKIIKEAKTEMERVLLEYFQENATDMLAEKINTGEKTLKGCWNYITVEAQKKAANGCACIPDQEVFGWATHYFEEDSIKEQKTGASLASASVSNDKKKNDHSSKARKVKPKPKAPPKQELMQLSLFDAM